MKTVKNPVWNVIIYISLYYMQRYSTTRKKQNTAVIVIIIAIKRE